VVALAPVHGENGVTANQPVVQAIEEGTSIRVKASPSGDQIRLLSDIAISKIVGVETFSYPGTKGPQIQIPEQNIRQIHLSSLLAPRTALLVDAGVAQADPQKSGSGNEHLAQRRLFILLQVNIVDMESHPQQLGMLSPR
jgi:hypothetical protein